MFFRKRRESELKESKRNSVAVEKSELAIDPCDVTPADGNPFALERVIYNQGAKGFSIAIGHWDASKEGGSNTTGRSGKILAMRWNGTETGDPNNTGFPSFGTVGGANNNNAKWFPLPQELNTAILQFVAETNLDFLVEKYAVRDVCKDK